MEFIFKEQKDHVKPENLKVIGSGIFNTPQEANEKASELAKEKNINVIYHETDKLDRLGLAKPFKQVDEKLIEKIIIPRKEKVIPKDTIFAPIGGTHPGVNLLDLFKKGSV